MVEDFLNDLGVFDGSNDFDFAIALRTGRDIDQ